jgi:putative nucleotidyltransferase with HDIG domain
MDTGLSNSTTATSLAAVSCIVRDVESLEPLPANAARVLRLLDDPDVNIRRLTESLTRDPALTAELLRIANSALYGFGPAWKSFSEVVMRLGLRRIRTLVLGAAMGRMLARPLSGYGLGREALWRHALSTAQSARYLANVIHFPDGEAAYVAGLLHDIGKVVLDRYVLEDGRQLAEVIRKADLRHWQAEQQLFGLDHAAVGGMIARKWQFPTELAEAIQFHHLPACAGVDPTLSAIVNVANALAPYHYGNQTTFGEREAQPEALALLDLSPEQLERLQAEVLEIGTQL